MLQLLELECSSAAKLITKSLVSEFSSVSKY